MQRLVVDQDTKRWVPLQPTHFFHLDTSEGEFASQLRLSTHIFTVESGKPGNEASIAYVKRQLLLLLLFFPADYLKSTTGKDFTSPTAAR